MIILYEAATVTEMGCMLLLMLYCVKNSVINFKGNTEPDITLQRISLQDDWSKAEELLHWFKAGASVDGFASLSFSKTLGQGARAAIHRQITHPVLEPRISIAQKYPGKFEKSTYTLDYMSLRWLALLSAARAMRNMLLVHYIHR